MTLAAEDRATEPPSAAPVVCSVVLSYNNFADTDECIASLVAQDYSGHSVILVDNHSTDGSLQRLRDKWAGRVEFVETGSNAGVAHGYNAGIRAALETGAQYVVVCNNDIAVEPVLVRSLLDVFRSDARIGMASALTLYYDHPDLVWFARCDLNPLLATTRNVGRGRPPSALPADLQGVWDTDYILTHAAMLSRAAIQEVGMMDERFFYGHDDIDYSLRVRKHGFRCVVVGVPLVKHKVSVTAGTRGSHVLGSRAAYTYGVGTILLGAKHLPRLRAIPFFTGLVTLRMPYTLLTMALAGRWPSAWAYVRGLAEGLRLYGAAFISGKEAV